jgi:hypothetical protein
MKRRGGFLMLAGLMLLQPAAARAQIRYTIQPLVKVGDRVGTAQIPPDSTGDFVVLRLDDSGRLDFFATLDQPTRSALIEAAAGQLTPLYREGDPLGNVPSPTFAGVPAAFNSSGQLLLTVQDSSAAHKALVQYSAGQLSVIAREGGDAPGGQWQSLAVATTAPMNEQGEVVFDAQVSKADGSGYHSGVFRWDAGTRQVSPVAQTGMKASGNFAWDSLNALAVNDRGEIAVHAIANQLSVDGVFLFDPSGSARPVALRGQSLPDGSTLASVEELVLDNGGGIAFHATSESHSGDSLDGVYRWGNGALTATGIVTGASAPGGGTFEEVGRLWINPQDGSLLVAAGLTDNPSGTTGLYRSAAGQLTAALVPGQTTPDGAINASPESLSTWEASPFNAAGQVACITDLADGGHAAYLLGPDGKRTLLLKSGMTTSLGTIYSLGSADVTENQQFARFPVGLNNRGQVAVPAEINTGLTLTDAILLLTPQ